MMVNNVAAFFDFDKTLLEVETGKMGFKWMQDRKMMPLGYALKVLTASILYQRDLVSEEHMGRVMLTYYKGKRLADYQPGAEAFYREYLKPRLAPNVLDRVRYHKRNGHRLVLISGSVRYPLEPVTRDLGFDDLLCTDLEEDEDGVLTGKSRGPLCVDEIKKQLTLKLANRYGLDLDLSFAYGNHHADIPLLELVGYPYVVEPNRRLGKVAREKSWPVLSFR